MPLWPGSHGVETYRRALTESGMAGVPVGVMLLNSTIMALAIAVGKIFISLLSAYALIYFKFPFRQTAFGRSSSP